MNMPVVNSERVDYHHVTNESNPLIAHISISAAITAQVTTSNEFCETEITYFIRHISNVIPIKSEHLQVLPFTKFVWNVTSEVISINVDLLQQCSFVRPPQLAGGNAPLKATLGQGKSKTLKAVKYPISGGASPNCAFPDNVSTSNFRS